MITDEEKRRKFVCVDPHDIPIVSFIDANMMASMPASLKAATGLDALTHAIEGFTTKGAWELADMLHLKAIEIISRSLRDSVAGHAVGVEAMALGQYVAGMGLSNVGVGLVHGMAHPLGVFYDTPHGVANAILLPHIMAFMLTTPAINSARLPLQCASRVHKRCRSRKRGKPPFPP